MNTKRPNILIVMTDHQRADTVLPEHPALTPNAARLAEEGVTFTDAFCPSPHCCPARATFFTGLYPSRHGVWNNICNDQALSRGVKPGVRMWSEDLASAGYRMFFSGKWHVSVEESPADRGWSELFVSGKKGDHHGATWERYQSLAGQAPVDTRGEGEILRPGYGTYHLYGEREPGPQDHDERAVREAVGALTGMSDGGDAPWCLYVGLIGPHDPYVVPPGHVDRIPLDRVPLPMNYGDRMQDKPRIYQRMRDTRFGQLSEREVREGIRHFWAYCGYLDGLLGRILDALDRTGQTDDTLVVFTSDHGDYCGEHGLFAKGIPCFQGAYRVPAIVRWPGGVKNPGRRCDAFVSLADFAPTFTDAAGADVEPNLSGASLLPFLAGETVRGWRDAIHTQCNGVELYYTQRSVMTRTHKYVFNGFDQDELYDLELDPDETVNRAADPAYEGTKYDLCRRMWQFAQQEGDAAINPYITVGLAPYGPSVAFDV